MPDIKASILTTEQCVLANAAFAGLDGFNKVENGKAVFVPYKFTDEVRKKMRHWKRALRAVADDYTDATNEVVREMSPKNNDLSMELVAVRVAYYKRIEALQEVKHTFTLPRLVLDGELLNEGRNPIPDSVLDNLDPIIDDTPAVAEADKPEGGE